jgi:hypothetical protein
MQTRIFPSAFNPCTLYLNKKDNGELINTLYLTNTCDTLFIQLSFAKEMYSGKGSIFFCDLMEAKDSGFPFLILKDTEMIMGKKIVEKNYDVRVQLIKQIIQDSNFFEFSLVNEYRVKSPTIFSVKDISEVINVILPNFYGEAIGVEFTTDKIKTDESNEIVKEESTEFIIRKTSFPDVYTIFKDPITPVLPNSTLFLPNILISKTLFDLLKNKNSIKLFCKFNTERHKWIPLLSI